MRINDIIDIKNKNAKNILDVIRFDDSYTKKEIAEKTMLSVATVSNLCNEMQERGIVMGNKVAEVRVGRRPNSVSFCYEKFCIVALDLQLENSLGFAIVNFRNNILFNELVDISHLSSPEEIVGFAKEKFEEYKANNDVGDVQFVGVGVSIPAVFDFFDETLIGSSVPRYEGVPFKRLLTEAFGMRTYLDNCAKLRAVSEEARTKFSNIVCMDISQGVGLGVISEGNLVCGKNGYGRRLPISPIGDMANGSPWFGGYGCVEEILGYNIIDS
jgi:predicted NBD/HSP70 family sugar kinase